MLSAGPPKRNRAGGTSLPRDPEPRPQPPLPHLAATLALLLGEAWGACGCPGGTGLDMHVQTTALGEVACAARGSLLLGAEQCRPAARRDAPALSGLCQGAGRPCWLRAGSSPSTAGRMGIGVFPLTEVSATPKCSFESHGKLHQNPRLFKKR